MVFQENHLTILLAHDSSEISYLFCKLRKMLKKLSSAAVFKYLQGMIKGISADAMVQYSQVHAENICLSGSMNTCYDVHCQAQTEIFLPL